MDSDIGSSWGVSYGYQFGVAMEVAKRGKFGSSSIILNHKKVLTKYTSNPFSLSETSISYRFSF